MAKELVVKIVEKSSTAGTPGKTSTKSGGSVMGAILKPLAAIGIGIALLSDLLKPILTVLKYILAVILLPILDVFLTIIKPALSGLLETFTNGSEKNKDLNSGIGTLKKGTETLAADTGLFGTIKDYNAGFKEIIDMTGFAGIAMRALGIILWPIVAVFDVLKAIAYAVVQAFTWIWQAGVFAGQKLREFALWVWEQLKVAWEAVSSIWSWISEQLSTVWGVVKAVWDTIAESLGVVWDAVKVVWETIKTTLETVWNAVKSVWDTIKDGLNTIWTSLKSVWDSIISALRNAWNKIQFWKKNKDEDGNNAFGGTVAKDGLYRLHAGETVNTRQGSAQSSGNVFNINISGSYNTNEIVRKLTSEIQRRVGI